MPNIKKILRYARHYGLKSTVGLVREKLLVDKKRFSESKIRKLPSFDFDYKKAILPDNIEHNQLNILYLIHYFYPLKKGGTERFNLNLAKEQIKLKNHALVLVLEANEDKSIYTESFGDILYRYYEYDGISCIGFRHKDKKAPLGLYYKSINLNDRAMREFARHITKKHEIDVVHATYPQPFASFLAECKVMALPYVVTCTDFCMMCHYSTMVDNNGDFCGGTCQQTKCAKVCKTYGCRDFKERHENALKVLSGAEIVTVPSKFVARVLGEEFPSVAFAPVSHGISDAFTYRARSGKVKSFVYAGTLSPLKGVHILISEFVKLKGDELSLKIYGEGDETYLAKLRSLADGRVEFCGAKPASEMPTIYSETDCVIVPSMWYETYNFVLREALMTGALCLASDIGAMPEAIDEGVNGFLFKPASKESLYEKMRAALDFDFDSYKLRSFPTTEDEGKIYAAIYSKATK